MEQGHKDFPLFPTPIAPLLFLFIPCPSPLPPLSLPSDVTGCLCIETNTFMKQ